MWVVAVGIGGAIGSLGRVALNRVLVHFLGAGFPWGTLTVNVLGSFCAGVVLARLGPQDSLPRFFFLGGVLGGFTTFSSFALDAWLATNQGKIGLVLLEIALNNGLSILAVALSYAVFRSL